MIKKMVLGVYLKRQTGLNAAGFHIDDIINMRNLRIRKKLFTLSDLGLNLALQADLGNYKKHTN